MQKASVREILEYIKLLGYISPWQLTTKFGYTKAGAIKRTWDLKNKGLITNTVQGKYNLTYNGLRRLEYYVSKDNNKNKGAGNERKQSPAGYQSPR